MGRSAWGIVLLISMAAFANGQSAYRYGTLSWMAVQDPAVPPNTVSFQLVTAWRYNFNWVYVSLVNGRTVDQSNLKPMIGDVVRVTGLTFADSSGQSTQAGTSEIVFQTGDGSKYFVDVTITAFSESENWLMGTTLIQHTYANPFYGRGQNIYPTGYSFEAGTGSSLDANQPYANIPYKASFSGCCRLGGNEGDPNINMPYRLETFVDLTDRSNSPASRSLPVITVTKDPSKQSPNFFFVLAQDQYLPSSNNPVSMSGGNTNYPVDDNMTSNTQLQYYVASSDDLGLPSTQYTPFYGAVVDEMTGKVTVDVNSVNPGLYGLAVSVKSSSSSQCVNRSSSTCECMTTGSGCSKTIIDFMVRVVSEELPVICSRSVTDGYQKINGWVGYQISAPVCVMGGSSTGANGQIVLNYVFAGLAVEASSMGINQAGQFGIVTYSSGDLNGQGLPPGAFLYSTATGAIVDVAFSFDNPFDAHRPGHDWAVAKTQRDYANAPGAVDLWNRGYRPVYQTGKSQANLDPTRLTSTLSYAVFDFNAGIGGAAVYMWVLRSDTGSAITNLLMSTCPDQEQQYAAAGFTKIPMNLNEGAETAVAVYLWYKKGTGPAIIDVLPRQVAVEGGCGCGAADMVRLGSCSASQACGMCSNPANPGGVYQLVPGDANEGTPSRQILLYYQTAQQQQVSRLLQWVPQVPGHYIFCYAGTDINRTCGGGTAACSSVERCIDMNVTADPAPAFQCGAQCSLSTYMGRILTFTISYLDIPHPDEVLDLRIDTVGLTLDGSVFVGNAVVAESGDLSRTSRVVQWFPDPSYGGFSGSVCYLAQDRSGPYRMAQTTRGCITVTVARCQWHVQAEDSLIQIGARFATNWLQVWHFNPTLLHPDDSLAPNTLVNIGHMYQVEPNDALSVLAERFGTSVMHIQMNNWDIRNGSSAALPVGKSICVIPSSCQTAANVQHA